MNPEQIASTLRELGVQEIVADGLIRFSHVTELSIGTVLNWLALLQMKEIIAALDTIDESTIDGRVPFSEACTLAEDMILAECRVAARTAPPGTCKLTIDAFPSDLRLLQIRDWVRSIPRLAGERGAQLATFHICD
jgi:hypothetical protein